jgi:Histidine kinase-, DNA gyrase B-, and HSP90-like ATPase
MFFIAAFLSSNLISSFLLRGNVNCSPTVGITWAFLGFEEQGIIGKPISSSKTEVYPRVLAYIFRRPGHGDEEEERLGEDFHPGFGDRDRGKGLRIEPIPCAPSVSGERVGISIRDTGIGLKAEDLAHIFAPFEQADNSASRRYLGTGLGLSLTRQLVELHGGRIWAESEGEGKGSKFSFFIPLNGKAS